MDRLQKPLAFGERQTRVHQHDLLIPYECEQRLFDPSSTHSSAATCYTPKFVTRPDTDATVHLMSDDRVHISAECALNELARQGAERDAQRSLSISGCPARQRQPTSVRLSLVSQLERPILVQHGRLAG